MSSQPLVSVIIPTYNCAAYIGEAIASVLAQTYKDYEIIVVDDGSTDDTRTVLDPFWHGIRYIKQENQGLPAARNTGIRHARGDLIAFLDADDVWMSMKLEFQVGALLRYPDAGLVFADFWDFDESGVVGDSRFKTWPGARAWFDRHRIKESKIACGQIYVNLLRSNWFHASSVVVRRDVLDIVGLFDETCRIGEDFDLWLRIAQKYLVLLINRVLTGYRNRPQSLSDSIGSRGKFALQGKLSVLEKHLRNKWIPQGLEHLVFKELSHHCGGLGWDCFAKNDFIEARRFYVHGIRYQPLYWQLWMYWLASFLPLSSIEAVRGFKRWRRGIRLHTEPTARHLAITPSGPQRPRRTI